jgi:hypothetical protein
MPASGTSRKNRWPNTSIFWSRKKNSTPEANHQFQSAFFSKLPPEVRATIYRYAIPGFGTVLHISNRNLRDNRLVHVPCLIDSECNPCDWVQDSAGPLQGWGLVHKACYHAFAAKFERRKFSRFESFFNVKVPADSTKAVTGRVRILLALMLTCRRMLVSPTNRIALKPLLNMK